MKKKIFLFAVIILMVFGVKNETLAQGKAFYVEVLGNGLLFSANYDMRFSSANDGLGGRIGVGYIGGNGASVVTVPVMLNYLLGKNGKYFEVGGGVTYASASLDFALSSDESAFY